MARRGVSIFSLFARTLQLPLSRSRRRPQAPRRARPLTLQTLEDRWVPAAYVLTDKPDYAPGETAAITGGGFVVGETVRLQVLHTDGTPNTGEGHDPWFVTDGGAGDLDGAADGNFRTTWYVSPDDSLGSTFELTADGNLGSRASTTFTDDIANGSFEDGLGGWVYDSGYVSTTSSHLYGPVSGSSFARLQTGRGTGTYTTLREDFTVNSGGAKISGHAFFDTDDYLPYNDDGYVRLSYGPDFATHITLFRSDVAAVGARGQTAWTRWEYTLPSAGTFRIEAAVRNVRDNGVASYLGLDAVSLIPLNSPPVAINDSRTTDEDTPVTINVLANDTDPNDDALAVVAVTQGANGSVGFNSGSVTYTPRKDFFGSDSFTYTVSDGRGGTASATVSVTAHPVNDPPTAGPDAATTAEDNAVALRVADLLGNDSAGPANEGGQRLTIVAVGSARHGTVLLDGGRIVFTPDPNYNGPAGFSYTVQDDGPGALTATGVVTVRVTAVNDAPAAANDTAATDEDAPVTIAVLGNDSVGPDENGQTLTVVAASALRGKVVINADGTLRYTPAADYNGPDTISYTVEDNGTTNGADPKTASATVAVAVNAVNDAPVAVNDLLFAPEDTPVTADLRANDRPGPANESGQALAVVALNNTAAAIGVPVATTSGTVVLNPDGTVTYTPAANYNGPDSFTYTVQDRGAPPLSASASGVVTINPVNDRPAAHGKSASTPEDTPVVVTLSGGDVETLPADLTFTITRLPDHGTLRRGGVVLRKDDSFTGPADVTYTPDPDYNGPDGFGYTVTDTGDPAGSLANRLTSAPATVSLTVTEVNDPPTAGNNTATTSEDNAVTINVLGNDSRGPANENGQTLTVVALGGPAHGTVVLNPDGTVTYTPAANYHGPDSFTYTVRDDGTTNGSADPKTSTATVSLTVTPVNDAPALVVPASAPVLKTYTRTFAFSAADVESSSFRYELVGQAHGASIDPVTGVFTWTPTEDQGPAEFTFHVRVTDDGDPAGSGANPSPLSDVRELRVTTLAADVIDGNLVVVGTSAGDTISVTTNSPTVVQVNGVTVGTFTVPGGGHIVVNAFESRNGQKNTVLIDGDVPAVIHGGNGADLLVGGSGDDTIYGGNGPDTLIGGGGDDYLDGGNGPDTFSGGPGHNAIVGGLGADLVVETGDVDFTLSDSRLTFGGKVDDLTGVETTDLTGGAGSNTFTLSGWTGTGRVHGGGGDDTFTVNTPTGSGTLTVDAGDGADAITVFASGGGGAVGVLAGTGDDRVTMNLAAAVTSTVNIEADGGAGDSVTVNGSPVGDRIALNGPTLTGGGTTVTLAGVENLTIDARAGGDTLTVAGTTLAGALTLVAGADADALTVSGVTAAGLTITGETVTIAGPVGAGAGGVAVTAETVTAAAAITTANGGSVLLAAGTIDVTTAGDVTADGPVTITAAGLSIAGDVTTTDDDVTVNAPVTLTGAVTVATGSGGVSFASTIDGGFGLTVNSTGATTFSGAVGGSTALASLTAGAGGTTAIAGGPVTTTGDQAFRDAVILGAGTSFTAANLGFDGPVSGPHALTVTGHTSINGGSVNTGDQTYNGPVTLLADATLTAGNVTFNGPVDGGYDLTVTSSGTTAFALPVSVASLTTDAGGTTAINGGSVTTSGDQTYGDPVVFGADTTLGGADLGFGGSVTGAGLTVDSTGSLSVAGSFTAGPTRVTSGGAVSIGGAVNAASLTVSSGLAQSYGVGITSGGAATLTGAGIAVAGTFTAANTSLSSTSGDIAVGGAFAAGATTLTSAGAFRVGGGFTTATLTADSAGPQTYGAGVTVAGAASLTGSGIAVTGTFTAGDTAVVSGGAVSVGGGVDVAGLGVASALGQSFGSVHAAGAATLGGADITVAGAFAAGTTAITSTGAVTVGGPTTVVGLTATSSGSQSYGAGVGAAGGVTLRASAITVTGDLAAGATSLTSTGGAIGVTGAFTGAATTIGSAGGVGVGGPVTTSGFSVVSAGAQTYGAGVTAGGAATLTGSGIAVAGDFTAGAAILTSTGGDIGVAGNFTAGTASVSSTGGSVTVGGGLTAAGTTIRSAAGVRVGGAVTVSSLDVTSPGGQTYGGRVTSGGAATLGGSSVSVAGDFTAGQTSLTSTGGDVEVSGAFGAAAATLTSARALNVGGSLSAASLTASSGAGQNYGGGVTVAGGAVLTGASVGIGGTATAGSLAVTAATISLRDVTTAGPQTYTGGVAFRGAYATTNSDFAVAGDTTLAAATMVSTAAGGVTFGGTVTGPYALAVNSGSATTFNGAVSVRSLTTDAGGTTAVNGGLVATTGNQTYGDAVTLGADATLTGADVGFTGSLSGAGLTIASDGAVTVGGAVAVSSLDVTSAGPQAYGGGITSDGAATLGGPSIGITGDFSAAPASLTSTAGDVAVTGSFTAGTTTILAGGGASIGGPVTAGAATVTAGTTAGFTGAVNAAGLTVRAGAISLRDVTTAGAQDYTGGVILRGSYRTAGGGFTITGDTTLAADTAVSTASGPVTFDGPLDGGGRRLTVDAGTGDVTLNGALSGLLDLDVSGGAIDLNAKLTASGEVVLSGTGPVTVDGAIDPTSVTLESSADVVINSPVLADVAIDVTAGGGVALAGPLTTAAGGTVTITAGGAVLDGNGPGGNIFTTTLVLTAGGGIGTAADPVETVALAGRAGENPTLALGADGGTGGVYLSHSGSLALGVIRADATVALAAGAAILDGNGTALNITAASLTLTAATGIGSGDRLETQVPVLNATNTTGGDIRIVNNPDAEGGPLEVTGISNPGGAVEVENFGTESAGVTVTGVVTASGTVTLISHSPLVVTGNITSSGGAVALKAEDGTLTVSGAIGTGAGGDVGLDAGTLKLERTSTIQTTGSVALAADTADFTGVNLGGANLRFTSDSASLILADSTFGRLDYTGTGVVGAAATFDVGGASFGELAISRDNATNISIFGDVARGGIGIYGDHATNISIAGDLATGISILGDFATNISVLGDVGTAISILGDNATDITFVGDVGGGVYITGDNATDITFVGDAATAILFQGDAATAVSVLGDFATAVSFVGDNAAGISFVGDGIRAAAFGGPIVVGDTATNILFVGDAATGISFIGDNPDGTGGLGISHVAFVGDVATGISFFGDNATDISFFGDVGTAITTLGDIATAITTLGDSATAVSTLGDVATAITTLGDIATAITTLGDVAMGITILGDSATGISFFGDVAAGITILGDNATNITVLGDVGTAISALGDFATAVSTLGDIATAITTLGDSATAVSTLGDIATAITTLGDVATGITVLGDNATNIVIVGDVATGITILGDNATAISFVGDVGTAITTLGDIATAVSTLGDAATAITTLGDVATAVSTLGDVATGITVLGDSATAITVLGDVGGNVVIGGDVHNADGSTTRVGNAANDLRFLGDVGGSVAIGGDNATAISFVGDVTGGVYLTGDAATGILFVGDAATGILFNGDAATAVSILGDAATALTFLGDHATALSFVGDGHNAPSFGGPIVIGDNATGILFVGDVGTSITVLGDFATGISVLGDVGTAITVLGDSATAITVLGDIHGTDVQLADGSVLPNVSALILGPNASNLTFDGDIGGAVFLVAAGIHDVTFTGGFADAIYIQGDDIHGVHFEATSFGDVGTPDPSPAPAPTPTPAPAPTPSPELADAAGGFHAFLADRDAADVRNGLVLITGRNVYDITFSGTAYRGIIAIAGDGVHGLHFDGGSFDQDLLLNGDDASDISYTTHQHGGAFIINGDNASRITYTAEADGGAFVIWGDGATDITYGVDTLGTADSPTGGALVIHGDSAGRVTFHGGRRDDALMIFGAAATGITFDGRGGDDYLVLAGDTSTGVAFAGGAGGDTAVVLGRGLAADLDGGADGDRYVIARTASGAITVKEAGAVSTDTLDFSGYQAGGVTLDLASTGPQTVAAGLTLTLSSGSGIEDVVGTAFDDTITGNARDNVLTGANLPTGADAGISAWDGRVQVVYLDFVTYNETIPGNAVAQHAYTQAERDAIQARVESAYQPFNDAFGSGGRVPFVFTQTQPASGEYATLYFNRTPWTTGGPGGEASEADFRNRNLGGEAAVQVNDILGNPGQPPEYYYAADGVTVTQNNWVTLSAKIAAHELGHLLGLRHQDAFGPIGYGIHSPPGAAGYNPAYPGAAAAFETFNHMIASGDSVGSNRFIDVDPANPLFFGEREAIRLAFALSGTTAAEQAAAHGTADTAQPLTLAPLTVPNTVLRGLNHGDVGFAVGAVAVTGRIELAADGHSETDVYSFAGKAGDLITLEVLSASLARLDGDAIDPVVRVVGPDGNLVADYTGVGFNDDQFEPNDATVLDLRLPADGTYSIRVDTFSSLYNPQHPDAPIPAQQGRYELFLYRFAAHNTTSGDDTFVASGGTDVVRGGDGDDTLKVPASASAATTFDGGTGTDAVAFAGTATVMAADATGYAGTATGGGGAVAFAGINAVLGTGPADLLVNGTARAATFTVTAADSGTFAFTGSGAPLAFGSMENLTGDTNEDTFVVVTGGTVTGAVDGAGGANTLVGPDAGATWNVTGPDGGDVAGVVAAFTRVQNLTGGSGNDRYVFVPSGGLAGRLDGGGGNNTLDYSAYAAAVTVDLTAGTATNVAEGLVLGSVQNAAGGAGDDVLTGDGQANVLTGNAGDDRLDGRAGDDTFVFDDAAAGTDTVVGGTGVDTLDLSDRATGVTLHLGTTGSGQAVGGGLNLVLAAVDLENVAGSALGPNKLTGNVLSNVLWGGSGNDHLDGGSGDDVLIGGAGDDMLVGGDGRDLLVGGFGADRDVAGSGDDVLVAGYTLWDGNVAALNAIRAEWSSANSYADRVNNIIGNAAGSTTWSSRLNRDPDGNYYYLMAAGGSGLTVFDDGSADRLTGSSGSDLFFADTSGAGALDTVTDQGASLKNGEQINDL